VAPHGGSAHTDGPWYRTYVVVWFWLLVITVLEIGAVAAALPRALLVTLLVVLSLMKAALIVAYFMHLRYERLNFIFAVLAPAILIVVLVAGVAPDGFNAVLLRR